MQTMQSNIHAGKKAAKRKYVLKVVATELPVSPPKDVTVVGGRKSHRLNRPSLL